LFSVLDDHIQNNETKTKNITAFFIREVLLLVQFSGTHSVQNNNMKKVK